MSTGFTFSEYENAAHSTADYPNMGANLLYPALGLSEEAGEVAGKIKKYWRNHGISEGALLTQEQRDAAIKEVGDVLWYAAAMCFEIGTTLEYAAKTNIEKLLDRKARGVIKSEGDSR